MRTLEEIYEVAQLMLKQGGIPRSEVEAWVGDQTQKLGEDRKSLDLLTSQVGETVTQKIMKDPLGAAKKTVDFLVKANEFLETVSIEDVGRVLNAIPKGIVNALAEDGFEAIADAGKAVGNFVVEELGRFGPGAIADAPGTAILDPIRKATKAIDVAGDLKRTLKLTPEGAGTRFTARIKDATGTEVPLNGIFVPDENVILMSGLGNPLLLPGEEGAAELGGPALREGIRELQKQFPKANRIEFARSGTTGGEVNRPVSIPLKPLKETVENAPIVRADDPVVDQAEALRQARGQPGAPNVAAGRAVVASRPPIDPNLPIIERIKQVRRNRMESLGLEDVEIPTLTKGDENVPFHQKWADIYSRADNEITPRTTEAWEAMAREAQDQYDWLTAAPEDGGAGVRFIMTDDDPYTKASQMISELEETGGIRVFRTPDDFNHPMMTPEQNDVFRSVHDMKHAERRAAFTIVGETEVSWQHLAEFTPEARRAVVVETIGQNSAYKYGHKKGFQDQRVFDVDDARLTDIGYSDIDDVPSVNVPDKAIPPPFEGESGAVADELALVANKVNDETGGATIRIGDAENLAGNDLWATGIGKKYERLAPEGRSFTNAEIADFMEETAEFRRANPDAVFGMWNDRARPGYEVFDHGRQEMNLTYTFPRMGDARNFALDQEQAAIMNLSDKLFENVSPQDAKGLANMRARLDNDVPSRNARRWAEFRKFSTPEELQAFRQTPTGRARASDVQARILENFSLSPDKADAAAAALVGHEAGRYYQSSARPLSEMFGVDAPRVFALHSALSPNAKVMAPLGATIDIWGDWVEAGRPASRAAMKQWLDAGKEKWGVTPTNLNNMERVLTVPEERLLEPNVLNNLVLGSPKGKGLQAGRALLSGNKVNPFAANYMGELQRFTMDTHMTDWFFPEHTGNSINFTEAFGGQVAARMSAEFLTNATGVTWRPAEFQAAGWATVVALKNLSKKKDLSDLPAIVEAMGLEGAGFSVPQSVSNFAELQEAIRNTPNAVSQMLADPKLRPGLERLQELGAIQGDIPTFRGDLDMLPDFLADPKVRLGDLLDVVRRLSESRENLPGIIALLLGQGLMDTPRGQEMLDGLADEAGLRIREAFDLNPQGTIDYLNLLQEQPEADAKTLQRFGEVRAIEKAPDLVSALRGSARDPEPFGRPSNAVRFEIVPPVEPEPVVAIVPSPPLDQVEPG